MVILGGLQLPAILLQILQVTLRHWRQISSAEDASLKALVRATTQISARSFEIFQSQEDDFICIDGCCDNFAITFMCDQFRGSENVNPIYMWMAVK